MADLVLMAELVLMVVVAAVRRELDNHQRWYGGCICGRCRQVAPIRALACPLVW